MIQFADLVNVYRRSVFLDGINLAEYTINDLDALLCLQKVLDCTDENIGVFQESQQNIEIGNTIRLSIDQPLKLGRIYNDYDSFVRSDMRSLFDSLSKKPFYIINQDIYSGDNSMPIEVGNYHLVKCMAEALSKMCSYRDDTHSKLIFFGKKTFELSTDVKSEYIDQFVQEINEIDDIKRQIIKDFCEWLGDESTNSHIDEKKSILSFVLNELFAHNNEKTILDIIINIKQMYESVQGQYSLYLENFCYEKFVKKLEDNSEKFVTRVNDTISKLLPQFLGIPILTVVPSALKIGNGPIIYLAVIAYCIICYLALINQKAVLDYLEIDVRDFEKKGKIPLSLQYQWIDDKKRIERLIDRQVRLYRALYLMVVFCFGYALGGLLTFVIYPIL